MGNAKFFRIFSIALLGLLFITAGLANAASSCTSEVQKAKDGAYEGCLVKMGDREFRIGAAQSSADGCSQVCGIMAELGSSHARSGKSASAARAIRE